MQILKIDILEYQEKEIKKELYIIIIMQNGYLNKYLKIRNKNHSSKPNEPLFISYFGKKLLKDSIEDVCNKAFELANLQGNGFTTHTLRHTAATLMLNYGDTDIVTLKDVLGHISIESTKIYTHLTNKEVRNAFESNPLSTFGLEGDEN